MCVCVCMLIKWVKRRGVLKKGKNILETLSCFPLDVWQRAETHCFQCHQPKDIGMRGQDRRG